VLVAIIVLIVLYFLIAYIFKDKVALKAEEIRKKKAEQNALELKKEGELRQRREQEARMLQKQQEEKVKNNIDSNRHDETDFLKVKGDLYERHVGRYLENKGFGVCQYGFRKGMDDGGIDIIAISPADRTRIFVQCKNWTSKPLTLEVLQEITAKLIKNSTKIKYDDYLDSMNPAVVQNYKKSSSSYRDEYFLCISSDKVVDLEIGKHLEMLGKDFYIYDNRLKIVVVRM
jgi:Holliday junction resolvase-like predicted endonuclease